MSLLEARLEYKPFEYSWASKYFNIAVNSVWSPEVSSMIGDIEDFHNASSAVQQVTARVTKGFVTMEELVGCYWKKTGERIPKPEIRQVCDAFSFFESIHQISYDHFTASIGVSDYKAITQNPVLQKRLGHYVNDPDIMVSLAVFSGVGEGVSLFSAFAILLSFCRGQKVSKFKGLDRIISYSARDEKLHSEFGCELFREFVKEQGLTEEQRQKIKVAFDLGLELEYNFIDQVFEGIENELPITSEDLKAYMRYRANNRLSALGLEPYFTLTENSIQDWFETATGGQNSHDFFVHSADGSSYSTLAQQEFENENYSDCF